MDDIKRIKSKRDLSRPAWRATLVHKSISQPHEMHVVQPYKRPSIPQNHGPGHTLRVLLQIHRFRKLTGVMVWVCHKSQKLVGHATPVTNIFKRRWVSASLIAMVLIVILGEVIPIIQPYFIEHTYAMGNGVNSLLPATSAAMESKIQYDA